MERWKLYAFAAALFAGLAWRIAGGAALIITGLLVLAGGK